MSQLPATILPGNLTLDIAGLRAPARKEYEFWREIIEPLLALPVDGILRTIGDLRVPGVAAKTIYKKYLAVKKRGLIALVNRKLAGPGWWKTVKGQVALSKEDIELVRRYAAMNQRSTKAAMKQLCRDWRARKVTTKTPIHSITRMPRGWSLRNLGRYAPPKFELKSVRIGRTAAASERPLVYTTRKGLWVGSHYMFDDMWHDFFVNSFAENQAGRPLELFSHDLYSARKVRWGVRVRTRKDDGTYNQLTEKMTRMILAATLHLDGYSPRGTKLVVEHGTAAIRGTTKEEKETHAVFRDGLDKILYDATGGLIEIRRSGMTGAAAHSGQYRGISKGNFRHKASLESGNNLTHNVFAALPGQTGKDVEHRPEELHGLLKHNAALLMARTRLPEERAKKLIFPLLELNEFIWKAEELYAAIEDDREHEVNDWIECGHVTQELLIGGNWVPLMDAVQTEEQAEVMERLIGEGLVKTRPVRKKRREVWREGCDELIRIGGHVVVAILGDDLAVPHRITGNHFEFEDADVGPGTHYYKALCKTPHGQTIRLRDGETFETFVNPFAPDTMFVRDADGSYLGECPRDLAPCRADEEAVRRKAGAAAKEESDLLTPMRITMMAEARKKTAMHRNNTEVLGGDAKRAAKAQRREDARVASVEGSLSDFTDAAAPEPEPEPMADEDGGSLRDFLDAEEPSTFPAE
jgi:hypothetical protein